jgi:hypothetical protein
MDFATKVRRRAAACQSVFDLQKTSRTARRASKLTEKTRWLRAHTYLARRRLGAKVYEADRPFVACEAEQGANRRCIDGPAAGECALKTEAVGGKKQVLNCATQRHKLFAPMYHPSTFVGVESRDSSKKKWRVVRLGFRQRALTGRRERVAFAQGLGKRASKRLAPLRSDAQEAPGEQLPVVGRSSGGAKHPLKLRIARRW